MLKLPASTRSRVAVLAPPVLVRAASGRGSERVHWVSQDQVGRDLAGLLKKNRPKEKSPKKRKRKKDEDFGPMLGNCPQMRRLYEMVAKAAPTDVTVLLVGESGTGKELVAREIHNRSDRRQKPYVTINCGAIPENLIESELFGHEKGAFTGASRARKGVFERAHGGTLFLDELVEMPVELQVKLLRVLESGLIMRVGSEKEKKIDVRVIAATNRRPGQAVADDDLREDLLYRLSVFPVTLPPLRERGEDVVLLAKHFVSELNEKAGAKKKLTAEAVKRLKRYHWPGNVRQLRNLVHRAHILAEGDLGLEELDRLVRGKDPLFSSADENPGAVESDAAENESPLDLAVGTTIADAEQQLILTTLDACDGDKNKAAEKLGISVKTIYNRLKQYEAESPE